MNFKRKNVKHMRNSNCKIHINSSGNFKNENANFVKSKKIRVIMIIFIFVIAIASYEVWAYFTHKTSKTNNIILGYNKISVNENYEPPLSIEKGSSFTKEPYVSNIGNVDCYVRIKSVVSDSRVGDYLSIDYNTNDFSFNEIDGYWYYKYLIKPGESTSALFTTVSIAEDAEDIIFDGFDIYVYAESVQSVDGLSMDEVWGYFDS